MAIALSIVILILVFVTPCGLPDFVLRWLLMSVRGIYGYFVRIARKYFIFFTLSAKSYIPQWIFRLSVRRELR